MMRKVFAMLVIALGALTTTTLSASAWECQGPAASCAKASAKTVSYKASKKKHYAAHKSSKRYASKKSSKRYASSKKKSKSYAYAGGSSLSGKASYYWQPQRVASGGWFNPNAMTAAHKTLPFGTKVRVTNRNNGKSVVVTINDRGPYIAGRIIDLSKAAAYAISMQGSGVVPVSVTVLGRG